VSFGSLCVVVVLALMAFVVAAFWIVGLIVYYVVYHRVPSIVGALPEFRRFVRDIGWLIPGAGAAFPLGFFPGVLWWIRRARRLRRDAVPPPPAWLDTVWPPPPQRGEARQVNRDIGQEESRSFRRER
jgi:hypothetical protein